MTGVRVLIIGSRGFIGSHLFEHLSLLGIDTWGCDIFAETHENYVQIRSDKFTDHIGDLLRKKQFTYCINCSGAANVSASFIDPGSDYVLNVQNVLLLLEELRKVNSSIRFMNLSSAAVYGNPLTLPVKENDSCAPLSPYGFHKRMAEILCSEYTDFFHVPSVSLRIFSAYGPGLQKQIFWDLYQKTRENKKVEVFGTGNETRDYIFIDDLVKAITCVLQNHSFDGSVINVANGISVSTRELVNIFFQELGFQSGYFFNGRVRSGDPLYWQADVGALRGLGYNPSVDFRSGVKKYVDWLHEKE